MKRLLNYAIFYNFYQNLIGCNRFLKNYTKDYLKLKDGDKVLDLGCGTANMVKYFPSGVKIDYTGIDFQKNYIDYCSKKYKNYTFICKNLLDEINLDKKFNIIYSEAVLAAISDEQIYKMFVTIQKHSDKNTRIILSDMNYKEDASFLMRFLQSNERNKNVRRKDDYIKLLTDYFNIDKVYELDNVYRIPYSKVVFECSLKN